MPKKVEWLLNNPNPNDPRQKGAIVTEEDALALLWSRQGKCRIVSEAHGAPAVGASPKPKPEPEPEPEPEKEEERADGVVDEDEVSSTADIAAPPEDRSVRPGGRRTLRGRRG